MSISYEGIGEWCATLGCGTGVNEGDIVKVGAGGTAAKCTAGDGFCGVVRAIAHDGKACSVQLGGLAGVKYSGTTAPAAGYAELMADGQGGVSVPGGGDGKAGDGEGMVSEHRGRTGGVHAGGEYHFGYHPVPPAGGILLPVSDVARVRGAGLHLAERGGGGAHLGEL